MFSNNSLAVVVSSFATNQEFFIPFNESVTIQINETTDEPLLLLINESGIVRTWNGTQTTWKPLPGIINIQKVPLTLQNDTQTNLSLTNRTTISVAPPTTIEFFPTGPYALEPITFVLPNMTDRFLRITSDTGIYHLSDIALPTVKFWAPHPGRYRVVLFFNNETAEQETELIVREVPRVVIPPSLVPETPVSLVCLPACNDTIEVTIHATNDRLIQTVSIANNSFVLSGLPSGQYTLTLTRDETVLHTQAFAVAPLSFIRPATPSITLGANITLTLSDDITTIIITTDQRSYTLAANERNLVFVPSETGNYTIQGFADSVAVANTSFTVTVSQPTIDVTPPARVLWSNTTLDLQLDFTDDVTPFQNIFQRIFGISPLDRFSVEVPGEERFNITLIPDGSSLALHIEAIRPIPEGTYPFIIQAFIDDINISREVHVVVPSLRMPVQDLTAPTQQPTIPVFRADESIRLNISFLPWTQSMRSPIDILQNKSIIDDVVAVVRGIDATAVQRIDIRTTSTDAIEALILLDTGIQGCFDLALVGRTTYRGIALTQPFCIDEEPSFAFTEQYPQIPSPLAPTDAIQLTTRQGAFRSDLVLNAALPLWSVRLWSGGKLLIDAGGNETITLANISAGSYRLEAIAANATDLQHHSWDITLEMNDTLAQLEAAKRPFPVLIHNRRNESFLRDTIYTKVSRKGFGVAQTKPAPELYDITVLPSDGLVDGITFRQVPSSTSAILQYDSITSNEGPQGHHEFLKGFALDPTSIQFTDGNITATAAGDTLWKCAAWNFSLGICQGSWVPIQKIIPGQRYNITLTPDDPAFTETGVVTINTNLTRIVPGTPIRIWIATLDKSGYKTTPEHIDTTVTLPNGDSIYFPYNSIDLGYVSPGLFSGIFSTTSQLGQYTIDVRATGYDLNYTTQSFFLVENNIPFHIIREGPFIFDPWQGDLTVPLRVVSLTSAEPFTIDEYVPLPLTVTDAGGATQIPTPSGTVLRWSGSNELAVTYQISAPLISPTQYALGPATVRQGTVEFSEATPWYLAADPTLTDTYVRANVSSVVRDGIINVTVAITCPGTGTPLGFRIYLEDDGANITTATTSKDFACQSGTAATCIASSGLTCTPNNDCTITIAGCAGGDTATIRWNLTAPGNNEALPSSNTITVESTLTTDETLDDSTSVQINTSGAGSPPTVTIITPEGGSTELRYGTITNPSAGRSAWGGNDTTVPPPSSRAPYTGRYEASTTNYTYLNHSDDNKFLTYVTDTAANQYATQAFVFDVNASTANILSMTFTHEGTGRKKNDQSQDMGFYIYLYNWTSDTYQLQATIAATTSDTTTPLTYTSGFSDYISGNRMYFLTQSDTATAASVQFGTVFLYTDMAYLTYTTRASLSGTVTVNATSQDTDGTRLCWYQYWNTTTNVTSRYNLTNVSSTVWINQSDTSIVTDGLYTLYVFCNDTTGLVGNDSVEVAISNAGITLNNVYPTNNTNFTTSDIVNFTWTASESQQGTLYCNLSINGRTNVSSRPTQSGVPTNYSINVSQGVHNWSISCIGSSGVTNATIPWWFRVDTRAPTVTATEPPTNSYNTTGSIVFKYNATDTTGINNCTLNLNGAAYRTNTTIYNGQSNNFTETLADGIYTWNITCRDVFQLNSTSTTRNFTVDTVEPTINLSRPLNNTGVTGPYVTFNFTVRDNLAANLSCNLSVNGAVVNSSLAVTNNTLRNVYTTFADGTYYWNVTCRDNAGKINTSETRILQVTGPPTIRLLAPANRSTSISSLNFSYNATDGDGISACTLMLNDNSYDTNFSVVSGGISNFSVTGLAEGNYSWYVNCTDTFATEGFSPTSFVTIDDTPPIFTLTEPLNDTQITTSTYTLNYTVIDNFDSNMSCNITINSFNYDTYNNASNNSKQVRTVTTGSGTKYWNVTCVDNAGNRATTPLHNYSVVGAPTVILDTPTNGSNKSGLNTQFRFYTEDLDTITSCTLILNNQQNVSQATPTNPGFTTLTSNLSQGFYDWTVNCTDNFGNTGTTNPWTIYIDNTPPTINLTAPPAGLSVNAQNLSFNFTVFDNRALPLSCNLTLNRTTSVANRNFAVLNNSNEVRNETSLAEGTTFWNVTCVDSVGNRNTSETRNFSIDYEPRVTLQTPGNNIQIKGNITLFYNVSDGSGFNSCSLWINDELNVTNTTIYPTSYNNFTLYNTREGVYWWYVTCNDTNNFVGTSSLRNFTVDNTAPTIQLYEPNGSAQITTTVYFNFSVTDNNASTFRCNLSINGTVSAPALFTATPGINQISRTGLPDGRSFWNVTCLDLANNTGYSSDTRNFTLDSSPLVYLQSPADQNVSDLNPIVFRYNVSESQLINCSLIINSSRYLTKNAAEIDWESNNGYNNFTTALPQGAYNWTVNCTDINDFVGTVAYRSLHVDVESPGAPILNGPLRNETVYSTNVTFNFTAQDNVDPTLQCNLTINSVVNLTNIDAGNGTEVTQKVQHFTVGTYFWNVSCWDNAYRINTSETRNFTIEIIPRVQHLTPDDNATKPTASVDVTYTPDSVTGFQPLGGCVLVVDQADVAVDVLVENGVPNTLTYNSFTEGNHTWWVNCTNNEGYTNIGEPRKIYIDLTNPTTTAHYPNGTRLNWSWTYFNFSVTDNMDSNLTCRIMINSTTRISNIPVLNNTANVTQNMSGFIDGTFYWNATCQDNGGRNGTSATLNFTIAEPPIVGLDAPVNLTRNNTRNWTLFFYPTDNSGNFANCSAILNNVTNATKYTIVNASLNNITVQNLTHGQYDWTINCTDRIDATATNSSRKTFYVDLQGPAIQQNYPGNNIFVNNDQVLFNYTVIDQFNLTTAINCNLSIDSLNFQNGTNYTTSGTTLFYFHNLTKGPHNWTVRCADDLGNTNTSQTLNFTINVPDLAINISDIDFNNTNPTENHNVTVNATVYNIGGSQASNFFILFYDNYVLFANISVASLTSGSNTTVTAQFNATVAFHPITVHAWYPDAEESLTNNNATNNFSVLYPAIVSPATGNSFMTSNVSFTFNISDYSTAYTGGSINYTIFIDGRTNVTGTAIDNTFFDIGLNFTEGNHTIQVQANGSRIDYDGRGLARTRNGTAITITIDLTAPQPNFTTANQTWFNTAYPQVFFFLRDNFDLVIDYVVYVDGTATNSSALANNTLGNVTLGPLSDGTYNITLEGIDNAGNRRNATPIVIYVDTVAPDVTLQTANHTNFSDSTPPINFTLVDNLAPIINYTIFVQDISNRQSNRSNNTPSHDNITAQADGTYRIIVEGTDLAGNKANSSEINITIDTTAPVIIIDSPQPNVVLGHTIDLLTTITDNIVGIDTVWYEIWNVSDNNNVIVVGTLLAGNSYDTTWNSIFNFSNMTDTNPVNFTVYANDSLGNKRNATVRFIVDNKKPSINFLFPVNDDVNSDFSFNITVRNDHLNNSHWNITNASGILIQNLSNSSIGVANYTWNTYINITNTTLYPEGIYNVTVIAQDSVGNNQTAYGTFRIDRSAPGIVLTAPANRTNFSTTYLTFNYTVYDNYVSYPTCNLTINSSVVNVSLVPNATLHTVLVQPISQGTHFWNVTCRDTAGNSNTSETRSFTIDTSAPIVGLGAPINQTYQSNTTATFYYTPTEEHTALNNCSLIFNSVINRTNTTLWNSIVNNFTVYDLSEGNYYWTVNCTDTMGFVGTNTSIKLITIDTTAPNATITTANWSLFNTANPGINFTISDNLDSMLNFTFFIDGIANATGNVSNNTPYGYNLVAVPDGNHTFLVEVFDDAGNRRNSSAIQITIDTTNPNVTGLYPANNTKLSQPVVNFTWITIDNLDIIQNCSLFIDGRLNTTNISTINNTATNISYTLPVGSHNWSVTCYDEVANNGSTGLLYFNITRPDITLNVSDISFNSTNPLEGDNVTIFANITNIDEGIAQNTLVEFWAGLPSATSTYLGNVTIPLLVQNQRITLNVSWIATLGQVPIVVKIDPLNSISETNETNNNATAFINISSWSYFVGNRSGNYVLASATNVTVFVWNATNNTNGAVYVTDYDSSILWTSLIALGINTTGNWTPNDFTDLDAKLNSTAFPDNITITYLANGYSKQQINITSFNHIITNVSIMNSTNSSAFKTGILWDSSDSNPGQFNGTQDVVFVSPFALASQGAYGIYDYEIRSPSELKKYKGPDIQSVALYMELA